MKYESSVTYHSKAMARQTDRPKTICPISIDAGAERNKCRCLDILKLRSYHLKLLKILR